MCYWDSAPSDGAGRLSNELYCRNQFSQKINHLFTSLKFWTETMMFRWQIQIWGKKKHFGNCFQSDKMLSNIKHFEFWVVSGLQRTESATVWTDIFLIQIDHFRFLMSQSHADLIFWCCLFGLLIPFCQKRLINGSD